MTDKCLKGMTKDTCPFNPLLGCDCGQNKPRKQVTAEEINSTEFPRAKKNGWI